MKKYLHHLDETCAPFIKALLKQNAANSKRCKKPKGDTKMRKKLGLDRLLTLWDYQDNKLSLLVE